MAENDDKQERKELNTSTLLLWMVISGGGIGGVSGFLSSGTGNAIDDHKDIKAEHAEIWREIRTIKGQQAENKARIDYLLHGK